MLLGQRKLLVLARYPETGRVKTRLIPFLGRDGATALHRRLVLRTIRVARRFCRQNGVDLELWYGATGEGASGVVETAFHHWLGADLRCYCQSGPDLGARMASAIQAAFDPGTTAVVLIGTDCPELTSEHLALAFEKLKSASVVFGPAHDGGYYLVGMNQPNPGLFQGPVWGTETVLARSLQILRSQGTPYRLLPELHDLDRPDDWARWQTTVAVEEQQWNGVSVIVPARNEASGILATLQHVGNSSEVDTVVVDGGSRDATVDLARQAGVPVLESLPGRARQMNHGAAEAQRNVLLFLHADTHLPPGWLEAVRTAFQTPGVVAGAFGFQIRDPFPGRAWIEWTTQLRARWLRLPYGDQALFCRRPIFDEMGGYPDLPILEDYIWVRKIRRYGRLVHLNPRAATSGRRWRRLGAFRTTWKNSLILAAYHLGVSPQRLATWYKGGAGEP